MVYWLIDLSIFRNKVYLQKFLAHANDKVVTKGVKQASRNLQWYLRWQACRTASFSQSSMIFKIASSLGTTPIRNLNFHTSDHARIRNHKHLEMQSCLDCSKLAQTCGKLVTSMPRTSVLVWDTLLWLCQTSTNKKTRNRVGLGRYGQQQYRSVFDRDLADMIRIRYDTHVNDLRFHNQEF